MEITKTEVSGVNRRRFLTGAAGTAGLAVIAAACSKDNKKATSTTTATKSGAIPAGDLDVAALAASLEVLAVGTYDAALTAASDKKLGEVSPAVAEFVTKVKAQHQDVLDKWNGVLKGAGRKEVTLPPADLKATVDKAFGSVTDQVGAAKLARMLEDIAAQTYLSAIPSLKSEAAIKLAGGVYTVDRQHIAVLDFVLGQYPVPVTFAPVDKAYVPPAA